MTYEQDITISLKVEALADPHNPPVSLFFSSFKQRILLLLFTYNLMQRQKKYFIP